MHMVSGWGDASRRWQLDASASGGTASGASPRGRGAPGRAKIVARQRVAGRGARARVRRHRSGGPRRAAWAQALGALPARADEVNGDAARKFRLLEEGGPELGARRAGLGVAIAEGGDALHAGGGGFIEPGLLMLLGRQQQDGETEPEHDSEQEHGNALLLCWFCKSAPPRAIADKRVFRAKGEPATGGKISANFIGSPGRHGAQARARAAVKPSLAMGLEYEKRRGGSRRTVDDAAACAPSTLSISLAGAGGRLQCPLSPTATRAGWRRGRDPGRVGAAADDAQQGGGAGQRRAPCAQQGGPRQAWRASGARQTGVGALGCDRDLRRRAKERRRGPRHRACDPARITPAGLWQPDRRR